MCQPQSLYAWSINMNCVNVVLTKFGMHLCDFHIWTIRRHWKFVAAPVEQKLQHWFEMKQKIKKKIKNEEVSEIYQWNESRIYIEDIEVRFIYKKCKCYAQHIVNQHIRP